MKPRDYDSTVARIAGNIASGLASKADLKGSGALGAEGLADWMKSIVMLSVGLARAIVDETKRTEPGTPSRLEPTWNTDPDDATHETAK